MKGFVKFFIPSGIDSLATQCGYCILAIVGIFLLYLLFRPRQLRVLKNIDGTVSLKKSALKKIIESTARDLGIQDRVRSDVKSSRGKLIINVVIQLGNWQKLADVAGLLQEKLKETFVNDLGLADAIKTNVVIAGFLTKKCKFQTSSWLKRTEIEKNSEISEIGNDTKSEETTESVFASEFDDSSMRIYDFSVNQQNDSEEKTED